MKLFFTFVFIVFFIVSGRSQSEKNIAIAENGDGIFSLLRKHGINHIKYYAAFLELNQAKLKKGSKLAIGQEYRLPNADDSFAKMGLKVTVDGTLEEPIFKNEFSNMQLQDLTLKNVTYYLVKPSNFNSNITSGSYIKSLAKELLVKGARVYIINNEFEFDDVDKDSYRLEKREILGSFISVINRYYFKNRGSYQRVLYIDDYTTVASNKSLSIKDYDKSEESKSLSYNLMSILKKKTNIHLEESDNENLLNLYFANNLIPPVTTLTIRNNVEKQKRNYDLSSLLLKGIEQDYSSVEFQGN